MAADRPHHEPDDLDRLLAQARWEEPGAERIARLAGRWRRMQAARRRRMVGALALAAGIVVAAGVVTWRSLLIAPETGTPLAERRVTKQPVPDPSPVEAPEPAPPAAPLVTSRDPNLYEQALLVRAFGRSTPTPSEPDPAAREAAAEKPWDRAGDHELARLAAVEVDDGRRRELLAALLERRTPRAVALYLDCVGEPRLRADALKVLGEMSDPPADLLLGYLESSQNSLRLAAALALSRLSDPAVVERVCASVSGFGRQEALIALLLNRSEQAAGCVDHARRNLYLVASVQAAERRLNLLQIPRGGNLP